MNENDLLILRKPRSQVCLNNRDRHGHYSNELAFSNVLYQAETDSMNIANGILRYLIDMDANDDDSDNNSIDSDNSDNNEMFIIGVEAIRIE